MQRGGGWKKSSRPPGHGTKRGVRSVLGGVVALTSLVAFAAPAHAQGYTFTRVVDGAADGFAPFSGCPAMNDRGDIAFRGTRVGAGQGIHRANADGSLTTIAESPRRFDFLGANPSINDLGEVSFAARLTAVDRTTGLRIQEILRGSGKRLTTVASTADEFDSFTFDTSVNDRGEVAFKAGLDSELGFDEGLFSGVDRRAGTTTHYLASTSDFTGSGGRPSINDLGEIAFDERVDGTFDPGVFATEGDAFKTILPPDTHFFVDTPSYNDAGTAAFLSDFFDETGAQYLAIATSNGGAITEVVDTKGPFAFFGPPSLNDGGDVAFRAELDSIVLPRPEGIFVGPDPVTDRVIATGEMLDGATVTDLTLCHEGLNDSGQLAFRAELRDPLTGETRSAIYRATPQ